MFSDCLCLFAEDSPLGAAALLDSVAYLSLTFAGQQLVLRGGVARGRHFHNRHLVFSEALGDAYELEQAVAVFPRTLVADSAADLARVHVPFLLRTDTDGRVFVDYLEWCSQQVGLPGHPYDGHKECILAGLKSSVDSPKVLAKYQWLAAYHDAKLTEVSRRPNGADVVRDRMYVAARG